MSEDINTNNEPVIEEELAQAPETKVEEVAEELGITASISEDVKPAVEENNVIDSVQKVVPAARKSSGIVNLKSGAFGSASAEKAEKKPAKKQEPKEETVAIHSTRNVTWNEVGKVYTGYNIVKKSAAEKWLTRGHIRLATPEEVAKEFGK
jgi:hypothetical protein